MQGDLEALSKRLSQTSDFKGTIIESNDSDYNYRMVVPRSILAPFMAGLIEELDYGNFKATLPHSDRRRHDAYYKCWKAMDEWQDRKKH